MAVSNLTAARLRELLHYEPLTGVFTWRVMPGSHRAKAGDVAGTLNKLGYWRIAVDGRDYRANRLAWFYVYEQWAGRQSCS